MNPVLELISGATLKIKEYEGQRVVTFFDVDTVHGRPEGTARKRFADNRERFIEGTDYFVVTPQILESAKMSEKRTIGIESISPRGTTFLTEQGYLLLVKSFTDDLAWNVQRQLVDGYFRVRKLSSELSPQMQMLYGMLDQMAETERQAKEAKELAEKAIETTESIKAAVQPFFDDWRSEITRKINRIQRESGISHKQLRTEVYTTLERRASCDLETRLKNKRQRILDNGYSKTAVNATNKMDVIEVDNNLREIFTKIVMEYEIRYCS